MTELETTDLRDVTGGNGNTEIPSWCIGGRRYSRAICPDEARRPQPTTQAPSTTNTSSSGQ